MPLLVWILIGFWGGLIAAITFIKFFAWLSPWRWAWWQWGWWPWRWPWWGWRWWPWWWQWWQWGWWPWWWLWSWLWWWWIIPLSFLIIVITLGFFECFEVWLILIIAILFVIIAGIRLIVSGGDEGQKDKSKLTIIYVIAGIVVVLFARVIVTSVNKAFG